MGANKIKFSCEDSPLCVSHTVTYSKIETEKGLYSADLNIQFDGSHRVYIEQSAYRLPPNPSFLYGLKRAKIKLDLVGFDVKLGTVNCGSLPLSVEVKYKIAGAQSETDVMDVGITDSVKVKVLANEKVNKSSSNEEEFTCTNFTISALTNNGFSPTWQFLPIANYKVLFGQLVNYNLCTLTKESDKSTSVKSMITIDASDLDLDGVPRIPWLITKIPFSGLRDSRLESDIAAELIKLLKVSKSGIYINEHDS